MFETITPAPPDAIFGLTEAFKKDPNPQKINLAAGVYKNREGQTPVLDSVKEAQRRLDANETTKSYLPIDGSPAYATVTQELLFGEEHEIRRHRRAVTAHTPGGTGALRVAGDFIQKIFPTAQIWISAPSWPNHPSVFEAAGLKVNTYPYFDAVDNGVDFGAMLGRLQEIPTGDVVLLHGCCHNPTGLDLTPEQWDRVAQLLGERGLIPLIDFAYQGFANGLDEDAIGVRTIANYCKEFLVANSYSKNFGLYNERVGALTLVAQDENTAKAALSHIKRCIRTNYSNPPAHGGRIVETVLTDSDLRQLWADEVKQMRARINSMRDLFVETLNEKGVDRDFSFIARQRGMFSFSGLTSEQVKRLREDHSIYIVGSGRINVAGMTEGNMDYLCEAIADVIK